MVRRITTGKASKASKAAPAATAKVADKATPAAADKALTAFGTGTATPYATLRQTAQGAYTAAALVVSGIAKLAGDKLAAGDAPSVALFRQIVGDTPVNYHRKLGNLEGSKLTSAGVAFFNARIEGTAKMFRTDIETVRAMVAAMSSDKGGKVEIGEQVVTLDRKVTVSIG